MGTSLECFFTLRVMLTQSKKTVRSQNSISVFLILHAIFGNSSEKLQLNQIEDNQMVSQTCSSIFGVALKSHLEVQCVPIDSLTSKYAKSKSWTQWRNVEFQVVF